MLSASSCCHLPFPDSLPGVLPWVLLLVAYVAVGNPFPLPVVLFPTKLG